MVAPSFRNGITTPHSPATWLHGIASTVVSPSPTRWHASQWMQEWITLKCVMIAPFGRPVVPEV